MRKKTVTIVILIFLVFLSLQACTSKNERFKGKTARPDQIQPIADTANLKVWKTKDLSFHYLLSSSLPDKLNLTGHISLSKHITNAYTKIKRLNFQISLLDKDGLVISTSNIHPLYSVYSNPPGKIKFNSDLSLPAEAVGFCLGYSGEFIGERASRESLYINHNPFH